MDHSFEIKVPFFLIIKLPFVITCKFAAFNLSSKVKKKTSNLQARVRTEYEP